MKLYPAAWTAWYVLAVLLCGLNAGAVSGPLLEPTPPAAPANGGPSRPLILEVMMHDTLQAASAEAFRSEMRAANKLRPAAILLNLSTPGGLAESAAEMASTIEHSAAPVIVYVREPGTRVSGEGLRLLMAGDVRAMNAQTTLVPLLARHATQTADIATRQAALLAELQGMAARRGRPKRNLAAFLENTAAVPSDQALQQGAVDLVASTEDHLIAAVHGVTIQRADGSSAVLQLGDGFITTVPMTWREQTMRALMNPNLAVLLLALGGLLLYLEINTPGGVIPGAAGLLLVLLATYALFHMPLRWQGLLLLALSGMLLLAEAHFQRGMALVLLAMAALAVGLRLLVRAPIPELEVNWGTAIGAGVGFGGITAGLLLLGLKARRAKVRTGAEAMLGTPQRYECFCACRRIGQSGTSDGCGSGSCAPAEPAGQLTIDSAPVPSRLP